MCLIVDKHACVYDGVSLISGTVSVYVEWMCVCVCDEDDYMLCSPLLRLFIIFLVIIKKVGVAELKINLVKRRIIIL